MPLPRCASANIVSGVPSRDRLSRQSTRQCSPCSARGLPLAGLLQGVRSIPLEQHQARCHPTNTPSLGGSHPRQNSCDFCGRHSGSQDCSVVRPRHNDATGGLLPREQPSIHCGSCTVVSRTSPALQEYLQFTIKSRLIKNENYICKPI